MSNGLQNLTGDFLQPQPLPPVRVVIIYESRAAATRAKAVLYHVAAPFSKEFNFAVEEWSFEMLRHSCVKNLVMQEISTADLVVVSVEHDARIPSEVVYGIMAWHPRADDTAPAVALLWHDEAEPAAEVPVEYLDLHSVAARNGMHLFYGGSKRAAENIDAEFKNFGGRAVRPLSSSGFASGRTLGEVGWGINE